MRELRTEVAIAYVLHVSSGSSPEIRRASTYRRKGSCPIFPRSKGGDVVWGVGVLPPDLRSDRATYIDGERRVRQLLVRHRAPRAHDEAGLDDLQERIRVGGLWILFRTRRLALDLPRLEPTQHVCLRGGQTLRDTERGKVTTGGSDEGVGR